MREEEEIETSGQVGKRWMEGEKRTETERQREREKENRILVDFEVTLWMKMNIFHDRWYVNDLKEEIGNLFSQSIFTRPLCIMLLMEDIRNVLIF